MPKSTTTALPAALREELGLSDTSARRPFIPSRGAGRGRGRGKGHTVLGRKDARKAARQEKKGGGLQVVGRGQSAVNGAQVGQAKTVRKKLVSASQTESTPLPKSSLAPPKRKERQDDAAAQTKKVKRVRIAEEEPASSHALDTKGKGKASSKASSNGTQQKHVTTTTPLERMLARSKGHDLPTASSSRSEAAEEIKDVKAKPRSRMTQRERDEEDEIRWLEYKLKGEKEEGEEDELDFLLGDLDRFKTGMFSDEEASGSGEEDEISVDLDEDDFGTDSQDEEDDLNLDEDSEEEDMTDSTDGSEENPPATPALANTPAKYVPPAARAAALAAAASSAGPTAAQIKLQRLAKGQLNRLGESNLDAILTVLVDLYASHPRADVSDTLCNLLLETVTSRADLGTRFVALYAALVAGLHAVVGIELGAEVVLRATERFIDRSEEATKLERKHLPTSGPPRIEAKDEDNTGPEGATSSAAPSASGKEALNLLTFLAELYNMHVLASPLMYDLIRHLLGPESSERPDGVEGELEDPAETGLTEMAIELLLRLIRTSGSQLRSDAPTSLRSIVTLTTARVASTPADRLGSRPRFMLEALTDLKNNRARASKGAAGGGGEEEMRLRMRKWIAGLGKRRTLKATEPLRVGLRDLQDAKTKGRWWLVGAAWAGHDGAEAEKAQGVTAARTLNAGETAEQDALTTLARRQGMNTDARRSVFVTLLSSEDYVDATRRLLQLKLTATLQREVPRVLVHCIGTERAYNPFYVLVGTQLCADRPDTRITLQYCLWDFLRGIGEKGVGGRSLHTDQDAADDDEGEGDFGDVLGKLKPDETIRIINTARAYAWWIAKGALSLAVLKTLDMPTLRPATQLFVRTLLTHACLSTQTRSPLHVLSLPASSRADATPLESMLVRGTTGNAQLARGLVWFLERRMDAHGQVGVGTQGRTKERLEWAVGIAKTTLGVGASLGGLDE